MKPNVRRSCVILLVRIIYVQMIKSNTEMPTVHPNVLFILSRIAERLSGVPATFELISMNGMAMNIISIRNAIIITKFTIGPFVCMESPFQNSTKADDINTAITKPSVTAFGIIDIFAILTIV